MKCIICGKSNEKSVCSDCENKKRCKVCNILKTDFYKYKNGKMYSTCIECFNKNLMCEFCNEEFNKTYLSKHLKRCTQSALGNINHDSNNYTNNEIINHDNNKYTNNFITNNEIISHNENHNNNIITNDDNDNNNNSMFNRTLIVGPSFCGKTHLLLNKLQLIRLDDNTRKIHFITRSPEQYNKIEIEDISVEEDLEDKSIQDFQNCCVVFDDMLDTSQKLIDPFFTRGRHNDLDVYYLSQSYFDLPKRTIRNNSNIIILFQQTLKDVEHIYRDIAGFDMSYEEFKELCREAWRERYNYLIINRLEDKNGSRYKICNESNPEYKTFNPQTDTF